MSFWDLPLELQFGLRNRALGKIKLRPGLPGPETLLRVVNEKELTFYRLLLETAWGSGKGISGVIDVGCRNGSYLLALAEFFSRADILANELDSGRRYWNLWRRGDYALAQARALSRQTGRRVEFVPGDFREIRYEQLPGRDARLAFTFFYPFVSPDPCRKWGLPAQFSVFSSLLRHVNALTRGTTPFSILSAHQGEWEAEIALRNYAEFGLSVREIVLPPEKFAGLWPSSYAVHLLILN